MEGGRLRYLAERRADCECRPGFAPRALKNPDNKPPEGNRAESRTH
jgi:hypothetical protein